MTCCWLCPGPPRRKNPTAHGKRGSSPLPALSRTIAASEDEIKEIAPDPKGAQIAWVTDSVSHRLEDPRHNEIHLVSTAGGEVRRLTNNLALENSPQWSGDGSKLYFHVGADAGTIDPPYRDVQGRLYVLDPHRWRSSAWAPTSEDRSKTTP